MSIISLADYKADQDCPELCSHSNFRLFDTNDGTDEWWDKYESDIDTISARFGLTFDEAMDMDLRGDFAFGD